MMTLVQLLDLMFPGDIGRKLPAFSRTGLVVDDIIDSELQRMLEKELSGSSTDDDINEVLKKLRKRRPQQMGIFTGIVLEQYFSCRQVVSAFHKNGEVTLFPHHRILEEMDYELLSPVMQKYGLDKQ